MHSSWWAAQVRNAFIVSNSSRLRSAVWWTNKNKVGLQPIILHESAWVTKFATFKSILLIHESVFVVAPGHGVKVFTVSTGFPSIRSGSWWGRPFPGTKPRSETTRSTIFYRRWQKTSQASHESSKSSRPLEPAANQRFPAGADHGPWTF